MISPGDGKDAAELCLYTSDEEIKVKKTHHWHATIGSDMKVCCQCGAAKAKVSFKEDGCGPYVEKYDNMPVPS